MTITDTGYVGSRIDGQAWSWSDERLDADRCRRIGRAEWDHRCTDDDYVPLQWAIRTDDDRVIVCWTDPA